MIVCFLRDNEFNIPKWLKQKATLVFIHDLLSEGWSINNTNFYDGVFVASGENISIKNIKGIINFIPAVHESDLHEIDKEDRGYAVQELNAFLTFFFSQITVPVINTPVPRTKTQTIKKIEEVIMKCYAFNIPVRERKYSSNAYPLYDSNVEIKSVCLIGDKYYGETDIIAKEKIIALANWLGVDFIEVLFIKEDSGYYFHNVNYMPDPSNEFLIENIFNFINSSN